jgi:hypothetical protein
MARVLILNADDLGYDPAVTRGIVESMTRGVVSSTTLMVNTPHSVDAGQQTGGLAVGLHLNLARFPAVSAPAHTFVEAEAPTLTADFVERETLAQLARLRTLTGRPATHVDVHKHLHQHPAVLEGLLRAAKASGVPVRSISETMRQACARAGVATNDVFLGDAGHDAYWTLERWLQHLDALPAHGVIELMCHPGYRPTSLSSGYSTQREVELETFTNDDARRALETRGLTLSSWARVGR